MSLRELLDELLTSPETGPRITALRHFEAKPAVFAPFPSSLDPRLVEALRARGIAELYSHQAEAFERVAKGEHVVVVTPTASGKTLCYNLPVLQALVAAARGARPLSVPDQGARPGPARRADRAGPDPARHAHVHLRRGHPPGRPARGAGPRQPRAHQPGHAPLRDPPPPHQVGEPAPGSPLHRHRRAARLPGRVRLAPGQRHPPAQAAVPALRVRAAVHPGLGHHRQPARARGAAHRRNRRRRSARAALPPATSSSSATTPRWSTPSSGSAPRISRRRPASPCDSSGGAWPPSSSARAGSPPRWCWRASSGASRTAPATPGSCAATGAGTCPCVGARSSRVCGRARCWEWWPPAPSNSASTSGISTWPCSPATPGPSPPCGSRRAAPGGGAAPRPPCWWRPARPWTSTSRRTPTTCSGRRPSTRGSTRRTRSSWSTT